LLKFGVVVFRVVSNDDHATPAFNAAALKETQEIPGAHCIKAVKLARKHEFAVAKAHRAEIANALARGVML